MNPRCSSSAVTPPTTHPGTAKRGRPRKLPMEEIKPRKQKMVTFSKRRTGLFNKASELCMLCDAQVALLVTSLRPEKKDPSAPAKAKVYAFGNTSVDTIFDAFLAGVVPQKMDAGTTRFALSLSNEVKRMESESSHTLQNKKRTRGVVGDLCPWVNLEEFEKSGKTVAELQALVDSLDKLKAKALSKLNSSSSLKHPIPGSNFPANISKDVKLTTTNAITSASTSDVFQLHGHDSTLNSFSGIGSVGGNDTWSTGCFEYNARRLLPIGDRSSFAYGNGMCFDCNQINNASAIAGCYNAQNPPPEAPQGRHENNVFQSSSSKSNLLGLAYASNQNGQASQDSSTVTSTLSQHQLCDQQAFLNKDKAANCRIMDGTVPNWDYLGPSNKAGFGSSLSDERFEFASLLSYPMHPSMANGDGTFDQLQLDTSDLSWLQSLT